MSFSEIIGLMPNIINLTNFIYIFLGMFAGIIIGAIPGMGAAMAISLLLPFTFRMEAVPAVLLLLAIYCGVSYGGSISSILIGAPGTPSAVATMFDGYPMMKKGKAGLALDMALKASFFGGIVSNFLLLFIAPLLAKVALALGPAEYFALGVFGLTIIIGLSGKNVYKGLIMGLMGLLLSTVGFDLITVAKRFTFGTLQLQSGIDRGSLMIGVYAVVELMRKLLDPNAVVQNKAALKMERLTFKQYISHWKTLVRSSILGSFIGAMPGMGGGTASLLAYNEACKASKHPETYGEGEIDGVCAAECANNAVTGSALIPMLTLGIPGDMVTAVLMGALVIQGIIPGPRLFVEHTEWVYSIMIGLLLVNVVMLLMGSSCIGLFSKISAVKDEILVPVVLIICIIGVFAQGEMTYYSLIVVIGSIVGYILSKNGFSMSPLIIGMVLGEIVEENMRRALMLSQGSISIFVTSPVCMILLTLAVGSLFMPIIKKQWAKRKVTKV